MCSEVTALTQEIVCVKWVEKSASMFKRDVQVHKGNDAGAPHHPIGSLEGGGVGAHFASVVRNLICVVSFVCASHTSFSGYLWQKKLRQQFWERCFVCLSLELDAMREVGKQCGRCVVHMHVLVIIAGSVSIRLHNAKNVGDSSKTHHVRGQQKPQFTQKSVFFLLKSSLQKGIISSPHFP